MPNQRYGLHHRICNLRYETLVRGGVSMGNDKNQTVGRELIYGSFYRCIGTKKSGRIEKVS